MLWMIFPEDFHMKPVVKNTLSNYPIPVEINRFNCYQEYINIITLLLLHMYAYVAILINDHPKTYGGA